MIQPCIEAWGKLPSFSGTDQHRFFAISKIHTSEKYSLVSNKYGKHLYIAKNVPQDTLVTFTEVNQCDQRWNGPNGCLKVD